MFQVSVRVSNPVEPSQSFTEKFWVDTRALYSFIPEDRLDAIGIDALRTREVVLADGRTQRRRFGEAKLTVEELGETLTCPVIFGPPGSLYQLGATALETFGVDADPVSKRLKPVAAVIGGFLEAPSSPPPPSPRG